MYSNNISTKIVPINLSYSNISIEGLAHKIRVKPDFTIVEPHKNKLLNINTDFIKKNKNGIYCGNLILIVNDDFFNVPFSLNYNRYLPEDTVLIER